MAKGVKYSPRQSRMISRNEAAAMLGCTVSTISNWVEKGIIKGHKVDNLLLVDKESIEKLFDTASDVAEMEKKLKDLRKNLADEIQQEEQKVKRLYEDGQRTIQDKFFKELTDSIVDTVKDRLSERDFIIVSGVLKGKPTLEIAKEAGCNVETVRHNWHRITPKLIELINDSTVRQEKEDLAEENVKDEIRRLKAELSQLQTEHRNRDLQASPLAKDLLDFGFSPHIYMTLSESGCKTLVDLLQYDAKRLLSLPNIGFASVRQIKERLDLMGLSLGMDLRTISDQKYDALVEKVNDFLPSDYADRLPQRFRGNERDDKKNLHLKDVKIASLQKKLLTQMDSIDRWKSKYEMLLEKHNILTAQVRHINSASRKKREEKLKDQQLKGISHQLRVKTLQLTDKKQQLKETDRQLAKTNGQLDKAIAKLGDASERENALLQKISDLENQVKYHKAEKSSLNSKFAEKERQLKEEIQQQKEETQQQKEIVRELNKTNAQLTQELSTISRATEKEEALLGRISSLESLVRYYIKERRVLFKKSVVSIEPKKR